MDKVTPIFKARAASEQAADWFERLEGGEISQAEFLEFLKWYQAHQTHKEAFEAIAGAWHGYGSLFNTETVNDQQTIQPETTPENQDPPRQINHRVWAFGTAALLMLAILFGVGLIQQQRLNSNGVYETAIGEQLTLTLSDGSEVNLNTNSRLRVEMTSDQRILYLDRGEAHFSVAPDSDWPFSVRTEEGEVTAVGTAFSICVKQSKTQVMITEGTVSILPGIRVPAIGDERSPAEARMLSEGHKVVFGQQIESIELLEIAVMERELSWREGMLFFDGDPLESVISQVGRYTQKQILIKEPELRQLRIGGYFPANQLDALLSTLEAGFGVHVDRSNPNLIYLTSASNETE